MFRKSIAAITCLPLALPIQAIGAVLDEVIVTAQKRQESLQDAPIAISVVGKDQLESRGIYGLEGLSSGVVSSLRESPWPNSPSTLIITIRGNGPTDVGPITRDSGTAIYLDDVYLARALGLTAEVVDLERIEVLRGPQGTLFGRNTSGGAVRLISKAPSGDFKFEQTVGVGNNDFRRSVTRIDLPETSGVSAKIDLLHSRRDGWVKNSMPGQDDYNAHEKDGGRVALRWMPVETITVDYSYDRSRVEATQSYFQLYFDRIGMIGAELDREHRTRYSVLQLDPTITKQDGHALTLELELQPKISFKSITAYRDLTEETRNNFGGTLYNNGYIAAVDVDQDQLSQEIQFIGTTESIDWVLGTFYLRERASELFQNLYSLDQFGLYTGTPLTPLIPPTSFNARPGTFDPLRDISSKLDSTAVYGQATYNPAFMSRKLFVTFGGRYTEDEKQSDRDQGGVMASFDLNNEYFDTAATVDYRWKESISTYLRYATGHQSGGVNPRSTAFSPFDESKVVSWEVGVKSELFGNRLRLNAAAFRGEYDDTPIEYSTADISITETINATRSVKVSGAELDFTAVPVEGLQISGSYTYLDGDIPLQPNPLMGNELQQFALTQTPQHAGSLSIDYSFQPFGIGILTAHLGVTSTSPYAYVQTDLVRKDAYTLLDASLTLSEVRLGDALLKVQAWGRNLTDEEYIVSGFPVGEVAFVQAFGDPRMYGFDLTLRF